MLSTDPLGSCAVLPGGPAPSVEVASRRRRTAWRQPHAVEGKGLPKSSFVAQRESEKGSTRKPGFRGGVILKSSLVLCGTLRTVFQILRSSILLPASVSEARQVKGREMLLTGLLDEAVDDVSDFPCGLAEQHRVMVGCS